MKTLAEMNPKVGDTVTFHSPYTQTCGDFRVEEKPSVTFRWSLRPVGGGAAWWPTGDANQPVWTFSVQSAPEPRYTLLQLNPKVGEVVLAHQNNGVSHEYHILCKWSGGCFRLKNVHTGGEWDCDYKIADMSMWTLKPKETKVTVGELNLSVGDRVTDGKRQGTVVYCGATCVDVWWDFCPISDRIYFDTKALFTKLPKPEPTLADLNLKTGDVVQLPEYSNLYGLVNGTDTFVVDVLLWSKAIKSYKLTQPASLLKKVLETPK